MDCGAVENILIFRLGFGIRYSCCGAAYRIPNVMWKPTRYVVGMTRLKIVLVGEESACIQTLKLLGRKGHTVTAVATSAGRHAGSTACVHDVALGLGFRVLPAGLVKDPSFAEFLRGEGVDILLNVHSLHIIHPSVLAAPRIGAFNLHPGPLPRYAGLNAVSWAIYRGETQHGVTIHKMGRDVDCGPIAYQEMFAVDDPDSGLTVSSRCTRTGLRLIENLVDAAAADPRSVPAREQDLTRREYFGREVPNGGVIDWNMPARRVRNFIRACDFAPFPSPWGIPVANIGGHIFNVLKADFTGRRTDVSPGTAQSIGPCEIVVACEDEWLRLTTAM
jgi:methionyl-tRNA formyltransferase